MFVLSSLVMPVFAQTPPSVTPISEETNLTDLINSSYATILGFLGALAGALAVAYLIYGGILYIQGNAESGKKIIVNVLVGVGIVVLAAVLVWTVLKLLGSPGASQ